MDGVGDYVRYCLQLLEVHKPSLLTKLRYNLPGTDSVFKINTSLPIIWLSVKVCFFFFFFSEFPENRSWEGVKCVEGMLWNTPLHNPQKEREQDAGRRAEQQRDLLGGPALFWLAGSQPHWTIVSTWCKSSTLLNSGSASQGVYDVRLAITPCVWGEPTPIRPRWFLYTQVCKP